MKKVIFCLLFPLILLAEAAPWGKDSDLSLPKKEGQKRLSFAAFLANKAINFHQKIISPTTGPRSSFRPTSSKYMELAIKRYGFFKGFLMGCDRLLRENNEDWVYRKIEIAGIEYKYDPARENKSN